MPRITKAQTWTLAAGAGALALGAAVWAFTGTRVSLPSSPEDAVAALAAGELDALDADRRAAWMEEARRLLRDMPPEDRRALLSDEQTRRAMGELMRDAIDERARAFARGEELTFGFRRGEGERGEGFRQMRERFEEMTEEERRAMMQERMEQAENDMRAQMSSGNAQSGGLRAEMGKRMGRGGRGGR